MSYREEWKHCKKFFPRIHCSRMSDGFRVVTDKDDRYMYMEIYSLGNGMTRKEAWQDADKSCEGVYQYMNKVFDSVV